MPFTIRRLPKRSEQTRLEENAEKFRVDAKNFADRIVKFITESFGNPSDLPNVTPPGIQPGFLRTMIPTAAPTNPEPFENVLNDVFNIILKGTTYWNHPYFLGYLPAGNSFANVYGDMLSTAFGGVGFSWTSQPSQIELENLVLDWFAAACNLPDQFCFTKSKFVGGGCLHNTASDATYTTIVSARDKYLKTVYNPKDPADHPGKHMAKVQCYTSRQAHHSVRKGCALAMCSISFLTVNEKNSLTGDILRNRIEKDKKLGLVPIYLCATLGTPGVCSYDDLESLGPVCQENKMWLHVDAAYAGNAFILKDMAHLLKGLEYADSIVINPYKMMLGACDLSCLYFKDTELYLRPFVINATYLISQHVPSGELEAKKQRTDFRHYGIALSRRMRSLKLWFLFRCYGMTGLRQYIQDLRHSAKTFESLLQSDPRFEIMNEVTLGVVCFRQKIPEGQENKKSPAGNFNLIDSFNRLLVQRINGQHKMNVTACTLRKRVVLRVSINYEYMTQEHIENAVAHIKNHYVQYMPSEGNMRSESFITEDDYKDYAYFEDYDQHDDDDNPIEDGNEDSQARSEIFDLTKFKRPPKISRIFNEDEIIFDIPTS